jgi:hypothetical protein
MVDLLDIEDNLAKDQELELDQPIGAGRTVLASHGGQASTHSVE